MSLAKPRFQTCCFGRPQRHEERTTAVSEETKKRVAEIAARLGYRPNFIARSLTHQRSFTIGLLMSQVNGDLAQDVLAASQEVLTARGCAPLVLTHNSYETQMRNLQICIDRGVDGIMINTWVEDDGTVRAEEVMKLLEETPAVEIFGDFLPGTVSFKGDFKTAAQDACELLLAKGCSKPTLILHDRVLEEGESHWNARQLLEGFNESVRGKKLEPQVIYHGIPSQSEEIDWVDLGRQAFASFLEAGGRTDGIICLHEGQAIGVLEVCREHGIALPEDLKMIAVGDSRAAVWSSPSVSSISNTGCEISKRATVALMQLIDGVENVAGADVRLLARERQTTA